MSKRLLDKLTALDKFIDVIMQNTLKKNGTIVIFTIKLEANKKFFIAVGHRTPHREFTKWRDTS